MLIDCESCCEVCACSLNLLLLCNAGTLLSFIDQLQRLGVADTPIASPLTALNRYLGHLGQDTVNEHAKPGWPLLAVSRRS